MLCDPEVVAVADSVHQVGFRALIFRKLSTVERTGMDLALKVQKYQVASLSVLPFCVLPI